MTLLLAAESGHAAASAGPSDLRLAVVAALVLVGTFFVLVGTLGLFRFPDVYNRMHATTKATTLGAASMFLAGFVRFGPWGAGLTSLVGIAFLFVTAPAGAHLISRAATKLDVEMYVEPSTAGRSNATDREETNGEDRGSNGTAETRTGRDDP